MNRFLSFIFAFVFSLSSVFAGDIPYNLLSQRIVAKLQKFGQRSINFYSLELFGSDDKESLIKTRKIIDSFDSDKKACGDFIYYWWYMWAPMSEHGFVENVYMTKAEAYDCCEIGEALHETKKAEKEIRLQKKYELWLKEGVPSSEKPNQYANISITAKAEIIDYIANHYPDSFDKSIIVKVSKDGQISFEGDEPEDKLLMNMLEIEVKNPAYYIFRDLGKSIPMDSYVEIPIKKVYTRLPTKLYRQQYEASVKFNKKSSKWEAKVTNDYKDDFNEDTGARKQEYLDAISTAIEHSGAKPQKYITFELRQCSLRIGGSSYQMPPKAILVGSQSLFDKMINK